MKDSGTLSLLVFVLKMNVGVFGSREGFLSALFVHSIVSNSPARYHTMLVRPSGAFK